MKRRKRSQDEGYDSFLDTMTNAVGILIVVLAVTETGVGDAVRKTNRLRALGLRGVYAQEAGSGPSAQEEAALFIPIPDEQRSAGKRRRVFMCRNGRAFQLDDSGLEKLVSERTLDLRGALDGADLRAAIVQRFDEQVIGDDFVRLRFEEANSLRPDGSVVRTLRAVILPRSDSAGEDTRDLLAPGSRYMWAMASLDPERDWLFYLVWDDSFETYIQARRLADRAGFEAGWKPLDRDAAYTELIGVEPDEQQATKPD